MKDVKLSRERKLVAGGRRWGKKVVWGEYAQYTHVLT